MLRSSHVALSILAFLLAIALLWAGYNSVEFYEDTIQTDWSENARRNPYLAAEKFFEDSGVSVRQADSLVRLNSLENVSTVLITDANQVVNPLQLKSVMTWLKAGGNLIVTANSYAGSDDLLLDEFNVEVKWPKQDKDLEEKTASESLREFNQKIDEGYSAEEIANFNTGRETITTIDFDDDIGELKIAFQSSKVLTHPYIHDDEDSVETQPFSWSSSEHGVHMMQFDVGDGLLTIVSDPTIWTSKRIGDHDHAYLLWILSSTTNDFAILHPALRDSIWVLISNNAFHLVLSLSVLIIFWIWHAGQRFGRIIPLEKASKRALSEHFSTTANYLWHRKAGNALLLPLRQCVIRQATMCIPEYSQKALTQQQQLIAKRCQLELETVIHAMQSNDLNETSFIRTVKLLKHIEHSL